MTPRCRHLLISGLLILAGLLATCSGPAATPGPEPIVLPEGEGPVADLRPTPPFDAETPWPLPGQQIKFEHISTVDGLSGSIYWITQDHLGFLWIGTNDGLDRYDGHNLKTYRHNPDNPYSLSEDNVFHVLEDRQGNLWVATYGGGLERFDRDREQFVHYRFDPDDPHSLSHNRIFSLYTDQSGVLWVGTSGGGLDRYDPESDGFVHYRHDPDDPESLAADTVTTIYEDRSGMLWIGTTDGLDRFDRQTGHFTHYQHDPQDPHSLSNNQVLTIVEDHFGALWVGTSGGGLNRMERETGQFTHFRHDPDDPYSLADDVVLVLLEDRAGTLWVASPGSGLHRFDRENERFIRYQHLPKDPDSLNSNSVNAMFEDREGTIWIGTTAGLDKYAPQKDKFDRFLDYEFTHAILEDRQGSVWIGTSDGLYQLDGNLAQVAAYQHDPDDPSSLSEGWVLSTYEDRSGTLWVGISDGGLNYLDRETGSFVHYQHDPNDPYSLSNDTVNVIYQDGEGVLWVGTDGGLNQFDPHSGTFHVWPTDPAAPGAARVESIGIILEDRQGNLWVSSWGNGLMRLDRELGQLVPYRHASDDPKSLKSNFVTAICEDSAGRLWVGTDGGLHLFEPTENNFRHLGKEHGLPAGSIGAITEDRNGNLWLSVGSGLSTFDPEAGLFANYDIERGLHGGSYGAVAWRRSNGELLFGGGEGVVVFDPQQIGANPYIPPVRLVALRQNGKAGQQQAVETVTLATFSWPQRDFEFEFVALSYVQPERNQHAYKLEGYDQDWNYIGTGRTGRYTNLPGGTYTLRLKGSNNDGVWNEEGISLQITVVPPIWATWWFRGIVALALVVVAVGGYWLRVRSVEARSHELERQVASRTRELSALNAIATVVSGSLDLEQILDGALDKTLEVTGLEAGGIYLLQEDASPGREASGVLEVVAHRGIAAPLVEAIDNLAVGEGFSGRVVQSGEPLLVRDLSVDTRLTRMAVRDEGYRSVALVPLVSRGRVLGSLFVMSRSEAEFSKQDVELLTSIGGQIGVAIENARLFKAEHRRAEQFRVISEVGQRITSILDIDEVLMQLVRLIHRSFGHDHVGIALVEGDEAVYKVGAGKLWDDPEFNFRPRRLKVGEQGITGWVAARGEPLLVPDVSKDPRYVWMQGSKTRSEVTVPIKVKGNVIGVLDVQSDCLHAFDESDLTMLQSLASQAAVAIENARLFDAEQRRAEQFRVISEVGSRVTSILTVEELLEQMARLIQKAFDYYLVEIGLVEQSDLVFKTRATRTEEGPFESFRLPVDEQSITGWVAAVGEPLLVPDVSQEPRYVQMTATETRSELVVPMKAKDKLIGVINVQSERIAAFDESDLSVLQSLANQAAIAIENARLYEQAQKLAVMEERQRLARELHDAVTQTLFSASLIAEALPDLWEGDQEEGRQLLRELRQLSRGALAEMRTLLLELRPAVLAEANLSDLLHQLGEAAAGRTGAAVKVVVEAHDPGTASGFHGPSDLISTLPTDVRIALYRIAQEALNNVVKHASASQIEVSLRCTALSPEQLRDSTPERLRDFTPERLRDSTANMDRKRPRNGFGISPRNGFRISRTRVELQVSDNGRGFDPSFSPSDRLGLGIIRERAQAIGGQLRVESQPGQGTQVSIVWEEAE